jgi:hypothetical protein
MFSDNLVRWGLIILEKRSGIKKIVTGGKIEEVFEIKETEEGKKVTSHKTVKDEEVERHGSKDSSR